MTEPAIEKKVKAEPIQCCVCYQECRADWICSTAAMHVTCASCCAQLVATQCPKCRGEFAKPKMLPNGLVQYDLFDEEKEFKRLLTVPGSSAKLKRLWPERPRCYTNQGFRYLKIACLHGNDEWAIHALDADCASDYYSYCRAFMTISGLHASESLLSIESEPFLAHVLQHHRPACMLQLQMSRHHFTLPESAACRGLLFSFISTYNLLRCDSVRQHVFDQLIRIGDVELLQLSVAQLGASFKASDVFLPILTRSSFEMIKWVLGLFPDHELKEAIWKEFDSAPSPSDTRVEFFIKNFAPQDWWWPRKWGRVPERFWSYRPVYRFNPSVGQWQAVAERNWGRGPFIDCEPPVGVFRIVSEDAPGPKTVTCDLHDTVYVLYFEQAAKVALFTSNVCYNSYRQWKLCPKQRISSDTICVVQNARVITFFGKSHRPF